MAQTSGVSRKVDRLGRIVLPAELRKELDINEGDLMEIAVDDDDRIVLEKVAQRCVFCRAAPPTELREFEHKLVCEPCVERLTGSAT
jgi:AbrB family transcriptional regulator, transcriptional pleiotropic regulator of transition state genes